MGGIDLALGRVHLLDGTLDECGVDSRVLGDLLDLAQEHAAGGAGCPTIGLNLGRFSEDESEFLFAETPLVVHHDGRVR